MLLLNAAQRDPTLGLLLNNNVFQKLFDKTIDFLNVMASQSRALLYNLNILKGMQQEWTTSPRAPMALTSIQTKIPVAIC